MVDLFNNYSKIDEETLKEVYYACNRNFEDTETRLIELFADLLIEAEHPVVDDQFKEDSPHSSNIGSAKKIKKGKNKALILKSEEEIQYKLFNDCDQVKDISYDQMIID